MSPRLGKRLPAMQEVSRILRPALVIALTCGFASSIRGEPLEFLSESLRQMIYICSDLWL